METTYIGTPNTRLQHIRTEFPVLHQQVNGKQLVYFDNAATTQKPKVVLDALTAYYEGYNSNIHRGAHALADKATRAFEETRLAAQAFVNAAEPQEIIFTKGCTDGINLVAASWGRANLQAGDEIIVGMMEHHSNIVPWQMICEQKGARVKVIPINERGELNMEAYAELLSERTKLVAIVHASNALGTINPIADIIAQAKKVGARILIDGAQASSHLPIDVQQLGCDFYVISAHKMYGPTGTGILYGKREALEDMPPYQGGGEMISEVSFEGTTYNQIPYKFEAGTPNIADVVAFKAAFDFVNALGKETIAAHEQQLLKHAHTRLQEINGLRLIGTAHEKVSVCSFVVDGIHPYDIGLMLDAQGIAVRTGHHCTQPLMKHLGLEGTVRASFAVYNTLDEIDRMVDALAGIIKRLS